MVSGSQSWTLPAAWPSTQPGSSCAAVCCCWYWLLPGLHGCLLASVCWASAQPRPAKICRRLLRLTCDLLPTTADTQAQLCCMPRRRGSSQAAPMQLSSQLILSKLVLLSAEHCSKPRARIAQSHALAGVGGAQGSAAPAGHVSARSSMERQVLQRPGAHIDTTRLHAGAGSAQGPAASAGLRAHLSARPSMEGQALQRPEGQAGSHDLLSMASHFLGTEHLQALDSLSTPRSWGR